MNNNLMVVKLEQKVIQAVVVVCTMMAAAISVSACLWGYYQPEEPECLRK